MKKIKEKLTNTIPDLLFQLLCLTLGLLYILIIVFALICFCLGIIVYIRKYINIPIPFAITTAILCGIMLTILYLKFLYEYDERNT